MNIRVRLNQGDKDGVRQAIEDAGEKGYEKGYIEGYNFVKERDSDRVIELENALLKLSGKYLEEKEKAEFNQKVIEDNAKLCIEKFDSLQNTLSTISERSNILQKRVVVLNKELTRLRQLTTNTVNAKVKREDKDRGKKKNRQSFIRREDGGFY